MSTTERCGYVAIAGRPNVGKSTLFNRVVGAHLSPVTHKLQTTRYNIRGVLTEAEHQIVFVDTPGLHYTHRRTLNRILRENAKHALRYVNLAILVSEYHVWSPDDQAVLNYIAANNKPCILVLNKCDRQKDKSTLLRIIQKAAERHDFLDIFPISALKDATFAKLTQAIARQLPPSSYQFPENWLTDETKRLVVSELIREQATIVLHHELPYTIHVEVEQFSVRQKHINIEALIFVEKATQRAIVIGACGKRIKYIATQARHGIENFIGQKVFLKLWVKVVDDWQNDPVILRRYASASG